MHDLVHHHPCLLSSPLCVQRWHSPWTPLGSRLGAAHAHVARARRRRRRWHHRLHRQLHQRWLRPSTHLLRRRGRAVIHLPAHRRVLHGEAAAGGRDVHLHRGRRERGRGGPAVRPNVQLQVRHAAQPSPRLCAVGALVVQAQRVDGCVLAKFQITSANPNALTLDLGSPVACLPPPFLHRRPCAARPTSRPRPWCLCAQ